MSFAIPPDLRREMWLHLHRRMVSHMEFKTHCSETYPSVRILEKLELQALAEMSFGPVPTRQDELVAKFFTPEAALMIEKHAWNEYNGYLLMRTAIERAWRFPLTAFDVRRGMQRLQEHCSNQELLARVTTGDFRALTEAELREAKQLGIVIDGLWCPWMESWEVINPIYLPPR